MYTKIPCEAKYQRLINKRQVASLKHCKGSKAFTEYLNGMNDIIEEYNPDKEHKIFIVFDDMIPGMLSNTKLNLIVTELFIGGRN